MWSPRRGPRRVPSQQAQGLIQRCGIRSHRNSRREGVASSLVLARTKGLTWATVTPRM
jgi:hypothetical protein